MRKERRDNQKRRELVRHLLAGNADLTVMAKEMRTTVEELARLVTDARVRRVVTALRELSELQTAMTLSRYRVLAASTLADLTAATSAETARKASVDLLKLAPVLPPAPKREDEEDGAAEAVIDDAVLLKLLGGAGDGAEEDAA
ncbi:MAG: hypothetical protein GC159_14540 [Phycisphaera sp.]|nr:hypothetical protein [Phycisphaera sp.]